MLAGIDHTECLEILWQFCAPSLLPVVLNLPELQLLGLILRITTGVVAVAEDLVGWPAAPEAVFGDFA